MNWDKINKENLGRRHGHETMQDIPPIPGPPARARKKNTYPCLPQPPRQPRVRKPAKVREIYPASQPLVRRGPLMPPLAGREVTT
jgi:hypothetical protein